ncbi:MAG TPA: glycosyltransferase family 1 protein [Planctomycetes bacterium]|nr:glycosyltransferase family 1 protein [Planctomycetota bacterium]
MRILVVTLRYPPYVAGGYELLTRDAVLELRARGHEVCVLAGRGTRFEENERVLPWLEPALPEDEDGGDLFELSRSGSNAQRFRMHFLSPANLTASRRAIAAFQPDIVFGFNLGLVSLAPLLAARLAGVKTLLYASDPWLANHWLREWKESPHHAAKAVRLEVLQRFWSSFRDLIDVGEVLTCSEYIRGVLASSGIDPASLSVAHLGVPPEMERLASEVDPPVREPGEALRVVCLSSFWDGKGQAYLLEGVAAARRSGAEVELVLAGAGGGGYLDALRRRAAEPDLAGAVRFEKPMDRAGVSALLASSHVFCLPSIWGEPFALSTLEAMAHGLAVVASEDGGTPEAFHDGREGVLVPARSGEAIAGALERLLADEPMRRRLGVAAQARARSELSHGSFVDRLEAALRRQVPSDAP